MSKIARGDSAAGATHQHVHLGEFWPCTRSDQGPVGVCPACLCLAGKPKIYLHSPLNEPTNGLVQGSFARCFLLGELRCEASKGRPS